MQRIYGHISKTSTTEAFILPFKCIDMPVPGKAKDQKKKKKKKKGKRSKRKKKANNT